MYALVLIIGLFFLLRYLSTPTPAGAVTRGVYGYAFKAIDGHLLPLEAYRGKVLLIVNTASLCGFTRQYAGLQTLYGKYRDKGLVVLGVPSNDFGRQEPGSAPEIKKFCETNFNITFPLADKVKVTGADAHPFFAQVREELGYWARPRWNFYKYLIGRDGHIVAWFSCVTAPCSGAIEKAVEAELAKTEATPENTE
jgi:glutathione peroxidase